MAAVRTVLGADAVAAARAAGRALSPEQAVAEASAVTSGGRATSRAVRTTAPSAGGGLTRRELEVLRLLVEGRSDKEIGRDLSISGQTAKKHVASILAKLIVPSRAAAVGAALRRGLA